MYNRIVVDEIVKIHREVMETYGSPRMTVELNNRGYSRCENTIAKLTVNTVNTDTHPNKASDRAG